MTGEATAQALYMCVCKIQLFFYLLYE